MLSKDIFDRLQDLLSFHFIQNSNFQSSKGIGKIGVTGYILGMVNGVSFALLICKGWSNPLCCWNVYMFFLSLFHFMEFFTTSLFQPTTLSYDSYIVNHSKSYTVAALGSWLEYWLEYCLLGNLKFFYTSIFYFGLVCVVAGQVIRTLAMIECGENFSHQIVDRKQNSHKLIVTGIYRVLRHPSYFGWFYWSIGTQLLLCNPICFIAYLVVSWKFFFQRIEYEEHLLMKFFGEEYDSYRKRTPVGIPLIR